MEPPSYEEASLHPPPLTTAGVNIPPPPSYDASLSSRSTPPPTYGEAVTIEPNPFPVLTPVSVPAAMSPPPQNPGTIIHLHTQVGVSSAVNSRQNQPVVVVTQPAPVPISLMCLRDSPGLICCPYCRHTVTTKVTYVPGATAWFLCVLLTLMGLVCGFCLIPLMIHRLHEAHHSCPRCGNHLHVYTR
ncbi:lipopolysaccharide-induced tumor necrosis factor-alpha factor homolog [Echeneis naucrates]|nr:lipopolysaccharide-induced tumor necrosis factor-alpha factor homolog [Echeneis naucrates]